MVVDGLETCFLSAERATASCVARQQVLFADEELLRVVTDVGRDFFMILNRQRQIVYGNRRLAEAVGVAAPAALIGQRPGEAFCCLHARETAGGCGTTEYCRQCGISQAVAACLDGEGQRGRECRLLCEGTPPRDALDLRVWAAPLVRAGEEFTVVVAADIGDEKRRRYLERIFFHDILNTAGGLRGFAELFHSGDDRSEETVEFIYRLACRLIDEIKGQREVLAAENNELVPAPQPVNGREFLERLIDDYAARDEWRDRRLELAAAAEAVEFVTDPELLARVVGGMVQNGLEAVVAGETVTVDCRRRGEEVRFSVRNPGAMPQPVQLQVFQRSFSTKGAGWGLGTYVMRLLSERYLGGRVSFLSNEADGTVFFVDFPLAWPAP